MKEPLTITKESFIQCILEARRVLDEASVPRTGRMIYDSKTGLIWDDKGVVCRYDLPANLKIIAEKS